jgi:hypothetical protein
MTTTQNIKNVSTPSVWLNRKLDTMIAENSKARKVAADALASDLVLRSFELDDLIIGQERAAVAYECKSILEKEGPHDLGAHAGRQIHHYTMSRGSSPVDNMQKDAKHVAWLEIYRTVEAEMSRP